MPIFLENAGVCGRMLTYADIGWTAVPLFLDNALPYLLDGCFQLPLYAGKLPAALLAGIEAKGCEEALLEYEASRYEAHVSS